MIACPVLVSPAGPYGERFRGSGSQDLLAALQAATRSPFGPSPEGPDQPQPQTGAMRGTVPRAEGQGPSAAAQPVSNGPGTGGSSPGAEPERPAEPQRSGGSQHAEPSQPDARAYVSGSRTSEPGPPLLVDPGEGDDQLVMHFRNEDLRQVLELLSDQGNLNILASNSVEGTVSASLNGVDIDSALEAILKATGYVARREGKFIYVGTPEDFRTMEQALDTIGTRVYRPSYVSASDLQTLIQPLVTPDIGVVSVSSQPETGIEADNTSAGGYNFAGGDVVVVRDYEAVLRQIDQVVGEIDVRPLQVAIEAMILSVKLEDSFKFGVDFELLRNKEHIRFGWGTPLNSLATFSFKKGGLKFGFLDTSLGTFLDALETIGDTNVIATPRLMVLNKQRAEILIGEQLGYVSTTITETSSSQSVEFLDVGAQLRLRPFISEDGLIRMEIHPELSTGSVDTSSGFTLPNKETTQVTTNIMVPDGCTVVIGGLMREQLETTGTQVPLLGSLPVIGVAFRRKTEKLQRREIIVLITPRIVREPEACVEGDQMACQFQRRQAAYAEKMSPLGKRSLARRYLRLAQDAWASGDLKLALRFAEMAVHFDPESRAAIELRARIWQAQSGGELLIEPATDAAVPTAPMDGQTIEPWILDELENPLPTRRPLPGRPARDGARQTDAVQPES
ncbi:MAG TPA: hypothetical protein EYH34_02690 [Planctomycetes bacterium]|nr:hypothetical protein [Planctomycetota bacterium]